MFLQGQAELALGSRFRALSESLYGLASEAYREVGHLLDGRWFPVLRYLQLQGPAPVTVIAEAIGQTHPAVVQLASKLQKAGWVSRRADRSDGRRTLVALTAQAEASLDTLGPVWCAIRRAVAGVAGEGRPNLLEGLAALEAEIASGGLALAIRTERARIETSALVVEPYRSDWAGHFERLNAEWLQRWFVLEPVDREVLGDPAKHVIAPGGDIRFATIDGEVIGTCALLHDAPGVYELSKMAVEVGWRGRGAGRALAQAAIAEFERRGGRELFLESSKRLAPALALYESLGFVHHPAPRPGSHYQRADVYMVYEPGAPRTARTGSRPRLRVAG